MATHDVSDPVHWSNLKRIAQSPAHYRESLLANRDTPSMQFGRLCHALLLGGTQIAIFPGERRAGKVWEQFKAENVGKEIVKESELAEARLVVDAVRANADAVTLLMGAKEKLVDWSYIGRACQSHIDVLGSRWVADLKLTKCAEPRRFRWDALQRGYHAQLAFYQDAAAFIRHPVEEAYLIAVENTAPYPVTVHRLTPRALEDGRKLNRLWMERVITCEAAGEWPGYVQSIVEFDTNEAPTTLILPDGEEVAA